MRIYLIQHGVAISKDVDPDRPLDEQGRKDVEQVAGFAKQGGIRFERVLHSGKTRAEQTAAILAADLLPAGRPLARTGLAPKDAVEPLAIETETWTQDTAIVGHLPFLGRLASLLIAGDPDRPTLAFQPGSLACLEKRADGRWELQWMIRPELLSRSRR